MATTRKRREKRSERRRAGSGKRDSQHKVGGDWTSITLPEGVDLWQPKEGTHRIDIVPYEVAEGNPYAEKGEWYYERTYWAHRGVGPNNSTYVCLAKSGGRPCPVCEYLAGVARDPDADQKIIDGLRAKERQLWLVYDHKQTDKGVQLWDFSHYNFGRLLDKMRGDAEEEDDYKKDFDDPEAGSTLGVSFSEEKGGGYTYLEAYAIEFRPRKNGLEDAILDHGICLDEVLKFEKYDKLKAVLLQIEEDDDEPEKPTRRTRPEPEAKQPVDDEPDDDDDGFFDDLDEDEEEKPEPPSKPEKKKAAKKPKRTPKKKSPPPPEDDDDDEEFDADFDDEDFDDEDD